MNKRDPSWLPYLLPRFQDVLFVAMYASVIGLGPRLLNMDGDLGRHLVVGGFILDTHTIPRADVFSHTMSGQSLTPHEWLAEVIFALIYRLGGLNGVVLFCAVLIALTFSLVYQQALRRSNSLLLSSSLSLAAAAAASLHWLARPHLFTMFFAVLWVGLLERYRRGEPSLILVFPGLMLLWANLHGGFIAGFAIWGMFLAGECIDHLIHSKKNQKTIQNLFNVGLLSFLASMLNPSGFELWRTSLGYLQNGYLVGHTAEYFPPDIHMPAAWPFFGLVAFSLLVILRSYKRMYTGHLFLLLSWAGMAFVSARNIPLFAVVAAPILVEYIAVAINDSKVPGSAPTSGARLYAIDSSLKGHLWPGAALVLAPLIFSLGFPLDFAQQGNRFDPRVFPVAAADWLEDQTIEGTMFNYFPWGGYLLYRFWPSERVFIDGQTDFYGEQLTRQYEQVITLGDGWQDVLNQHNVSLVIMPADSALASFLQSLPEWKAIYRDQTSLILAIRPGKTAREQGPSP